MSVDAIIIVSKVPRRIVNDEWLKQKSFDICTAIGAKHFFISDGMLPGDYEVAAKAWHQAFKEHPLYQSFNDAVSRESRTEIRNKICADVGVAPEDRRLAIELTHERREADDPPPGTKYTGDGGLELEAEPDECLLQLNLYGSYYGPHYERGDILAYCAMAEWLELNIPGCEVWYGGDTVDLRRFNYHYRKELRQHLYSKNGRAYFHSRNESVAPPPCGLCPGGKYCGSQFGYGHNYAAFSCSGCGKSVKTDDAGRTWSKHKDE